MAEQNRRTFLQWLTYGLGAIFAAVLGVPAVAYLLDPRNRAAAKSAYRTVARLEDLQVNVPQVVIIRETRRDGWNLYPDEIVGRVFLIRRNATKVDAYTTICPHLGCSINYTGSAELPFVCPCHGGRFDIDGHLIDPTNNPAPRGMDSLDVQEDPNKPGYLQVKYASFRQGEHDKIPKT